MIEIELLEIPNQGCPVKNFILGLDPKPQKKVLRMLELFNKDPIHYMKDSELFAKMPGYEKYKLYEFRILYNRTYYRILSCLRQGKCYLVHGFIKKGKKTRRSDLNTAITRISTYIL